MVTRVAILLAVIVAASAVPSSIKYDDINKGQNSWKAGHNEIIDSGFENMKRLCGAKLPEPEDRLPVKEDDEIPEENIPQTFDARQNWHNCRSVSSIKNQGQCGSCWAVSIASAVSDRLCIASHGKVQLNISAENLLSCCSVCSVTGGCDGGYPDKAWRYIKTSGLVTGGDYDSNEGCQPYEIAPSESDGHIPTPACHKTCTNTKYSLPYSKDKHFDKNAYSLPAGNVLAIQRDILKNGPVVATFDVYIDFYAYTSGVYQHFIPILVGRHAVKVLGWGVDQGQDYWLVANSWGRNFGENGYFRIVRGKNECNFEKYVTGGLVKH